MPIDFSGLGRTDTDLLVDPRELFASLARPADYAFLRDVQGQVLGQWFDRRTESDLSVKMNTGTGKTVVGLLILQSSLNEGVGPALYVAPDNYLASQVVAQAAELGIEVTQDPESDAYHSGSAIGVVNIHKLFNGRSVFGGPGSGRSERIPIGSLVIDDAHAALAIVEQQATITIDASHPAYRDLLGLFGDALSAQGNMKYMDIVSGDSRSILRIPFWSWADRTNEVLTILRDSSSDSSIGFPLALISDLLPISEAVISGSELQIRPPLPPVQLVRSFAGAQRRVYLTATLADDAVLISHFNVSAASAESPITPPSASDMGDRLILAPMTASSRITFSDIRRLAERTAEEHNVVILVPSERRASSWREAGAEVVFAAQMQDIVGRLVTGHVGLVALVNKYDGVDLPNEACRLLVIDGVPEAYGVIDRRTASALGTAAAMSSRQLQRIEQGMGRGTRGSDDHCVVILADQRTSQLVARARATSGLGPATQAQVVLSNEVAAQLEDGPIEDFEAAMRAVLDRDHDWIAASRRALAQTRYTDASVAPHVIFSRGAFNSALAGNWVASIRSMEEAANSVHDDETKGLLKEQIAVYSHQVDRVQAQAILQSAKRMNPNVVTPSSGFTYQRLTDSRSQAETLSSFLTRTYGSPAEIVPSWDLLSTFLTFNADETNAFEESVMQLGLHIGLEAQRPDRDISEGPDVLWVCSRQQAVTIECKSGTASQEITRSDMSQLANSARWFEQEYRDSDAPAPTLIHPSSTLSVGAAPPPNARVIQQQGINDLASETRELLVAIATSGRLDDVGAIETQIRERHLNVQGILSRHSTAIRS